MLFRSLCAVLFSLLYFQVSAQRVISLNSDSGFVQWKLKAQDELQSDSVNIYKSGYDVSKWVSAVVPGTVFTSYVQAGIEKDPNYGDNIYQVDKSRYNRNFWYRASFLSPVMLEGEELWLNFDGINRKGEVFFNGYRLAELDGFMQRGRFNISSLLRKNEENVIAVLVKYPPAPIPNYQSPTYISSDSWDWMPSVPGLLSGLTDKVYLSTTGSVRISDPWIRTAVPSLDTGLVSIQLDLSNSSPAKVSGECIISVNPGNIILRQQVEFNAGEQKSIAFDPKQYNDLRILNPRLWWPNGYGDPNLYKCEIRFVSNNRLSDERKLNFGIREYSYDTTGSVFHLSINGKRIFVKGGNWGMSEYLLRCRGEEYDLKLKLHREMNMNMVRNWIGSVTDEAFYDACDKYGIMIWDDFWLNSHPNLPFDLFAFNENAVEKIKRFRNHAALAVWCGDNEGYPLPPLDGWLREDIKAFDGGDRWYQSNSHSDALTGSGPWTNFPADWYFTKYPGGFGGNSGWGFRTEIGTAVFTTFESFKKFIPEKDWWPRNEMWNKHYFGKSAGNAGPDRYEKSINEEYGTATGIEDFCSKAQLLNIVTNKALFEGWQQHMWNDASGVMTWMSQSAYPSFVWQTYDYYYDLNGAYWGVKKACEPVHIQWNPTNNNVSLINTSSAAIQGAVAEAEVYNLDGSRQAKYAMKETVNGPSNQSTFCFSIPFIQNNLAYQKEVHASSHSGQYEFPALIADGNSSSRWSSSYKDDEWIYVDLGKTSPVSMVILNWEAAYAKSYSIETGLDTTNWTKVYSTETGDGNIDTIKFAAVEARYVRMHGIKRASQWGFSLYEMEVYKDQLIKSDLSDVHFIRLKLKSADGKLLSENFYWRGIRNNDFTALSSLPKASLKVRSAINSANGKSTIRATITNTGKSTAFAIHVQAYRKADGERILPAIMNDNYFTLFKKESKEIEIEFDSALLDNGAYEIVAIPFGER